MKELVKEFNCSSPLAATTPMLPLSEALTAGKRATTAAFEGEDRQRQLRGTLLVARECQPGRGEMQQAGEEEAPTPHFWILCSDPCPALPAFCHSSGSLAGQHRQTRAFQTTSSPGKCHTVCGISTSPHGGCVEPFGALSKGARLEP